MSKNKKTPTPVTAIPKDDVFRLDKSLFEDGDLFESSNPLDQLTGSMFNNFFTSALELTRLIVEKDASIKTKHQILEAYQDSLKTIASSCEDITA